MNDPDSRPHEVLLQHQAFLRALARGLLGDEHAADDAVQTAWVAAVERPPEGLDTPRAWMARVTQNVAGKLRRSEGRRAARERAAARREALPSTAETVEREELLRSVTDAVLALEEPYRSTVMSRYYEGLDARAIAARERLPLATVRSRLSRALARLREQLDRRHGGREVWGMGLAALLGWERFAPLGAATAGSGSTTSVLVGTTIMTSKLNLIALSAALVLVLLAVWRVSAELGEPVPAADVARAATPVALEGPASVATTTAAVDEREPVRVVASESQTPAEALVEEPGTVAIAARVTWHDGTPAAGVWFDVMPWGAPQPFLARCKACTDVSGRFRVEGLAPGLVALYGDRGATGSARLEAGGEREVELVLEEHLDVLGRVTDVAGRTVADAEIWLSKASDASDGRPVARTDGAGRFRLRSVSERNWIGARKEGHAPSPVLHVEGGRGDELELGLILQGEGASVSLVVVDEAGRPVEGACVRVNDQAFSSRGYSRDVAVFPPIRIQETTGADGGLFVAGLAPGRAEIVVSKAGLAPRTVELELVTGPARRVDVTLERGAFLTGSVTSTDGTPLAGAVVRCGAYGDLAAREAKSANDGSFRLADVPSGRVVVQAALDGVGTASTSMHVTSGTKLVWNVVLDAGLVLAGRLIDEDGVGLQGWSVQVHTTEGDSEDALAARPRFLSSAATDASGRFRILNCPDEPLSVRVNQTSGAWYYTVGEFHDLRPGRDAHELVVPATWRATAHVRGTLYDDVGAPATAELTLTNDRWKHDATLWSKDGTGDFDFGPIAPGSYSLVASAPGGGRIAVQGLDVRSDAKLDLGALRLELPGRLELDVTLPDGIDPRAVQLYVKGDGPPTQRDASRASESIELPVGRYELQVFGAVVRESVAFEIEADRATRLAVAPEVGVRVQLRIGAPAGGELPQHVRATFRSLDGRDVHEETLFVNREHRLALVRLPVADGYDVELEAGGLRGRASLGKTDLDPAHEKRGRLVDVVLR